MPKTEACGKAWTHIREEVMENYELREGSGQGEWGRIGPIKDPTPANAKNKGAADKRRAVTNTTCPGSEEAGHEMQGTSGTVPRREQHQNRQQEANNDVREDEEATHVTWGTVEEAIQGADMAHPAAKGAEIQETSTAAPSQTAHEHPINTTTSVE